MNDPQLTFSLTSVRVSPALTGLIVVDLLKLNEPIVRSWKTTKRMSTAQIWIPSKVIYLLRMVLLTSRSGPKLMFWRAPGMFVPMTAKATSPCL